MQAFLLFTSALNDKDTNAAILDFCRALGIDGVTTLSRSEELGAAILAKTDRQVDIIAARAHFAPRKIDINMLNEAPTKKRLLLSDMDSTIITTESLDELSELAGIGEAIKAITKRAMAGELDFMEALHERLSMLAGQPAHLLTDVIEGTEIFDGADHFIRTMRHHGADCYLVSGGFTFLTSVIAAQLGFTDHVANTLDIADDKVAGTVSGTLVDSQAKLRLLNEKCASLNCSLNDAMTIGDGANDIPMLQAAGLGVAWQAKEIVKQSVPIHLSHSSHCGGLFLQGYDESEIL